jgi:hypothetical protein
MSSNTDERIMKDFQWLCEHSLEIDEKYAGEYIAIVDQKIVAHGKDFFKVMEEATKIDPRPLVGEALIPGRLIV